MRVSQIVLTEFLPANGFIVTLLSSSVSHDTHVDMRHYNLGRQFDWLFQKHSVCRIFHNKSPLGNKSPEIKSPGHKSPPGNKSLGNKSPSDIKCPEKKSLENESPLAHLEHCCFCRNSSLWFQAMFSRKFH